jgi:hypothetical protein
VIRILALAAFIVGMVAIVVALEGVHVQPLTPAERARADADMSLLLLLQIQENE